MIDPYRMVVVNIVASGLLLAGTIIYRFIYPKRKINLFFLLILISILPLISIFRNGDYESGDFNIHIYRMMSFYDSLMEGNLMPSWAAELNATYGNPLFIFNYSLPYYGVSFFHLIGFSFIMSMKIYLALTFFFSGIFMYLWIRKLMRNDLAAFTSSIFYLFNPYHLIDVHFRATLGESTIFTLVPLLLFFLTIYLKEKKIIYLVFISLVSQLLFLAHPLVAGIFLVISVLFVVSITNIKKNFKNVFLAITSLAFGAIASIYCWFSFILYSPYVSPQPGGITWQFNQFYQIIYAPWRYGFLFQGPKGELAPILGYTQIFVVIITIILLIINKISKKFKLYIVFWLLIIFSILFFMTQYSKMIWSYFPLLMMLESNRLLLPIALATSVVAGYFVISFSNNKKGKIFIYVLLLITIGYTILNWGHRRLISEINDAVLRKNVWISTATEGPTYFLNNKWADINNLWFLELPNQHLEIIRGKGIVKEIKRTSTQHSYLVDTQTPVIIKENTLYYPGWSLKSNYNTIPIYPGKRGIINAKLPKGQQYLELYYRDIPIYALTKIIGGLSFLGLLFIILLYFISIIIKKNVFIKSA